MLTKFWRSVPLSLGFSAFADKALTGLWLQPDTEDGVCYGVFRTSVVGVQYYVGQVNLGEARCALFLRPQSACDTVPAASFHYGAKLESSTFPAKDDCYSSSSASIEEGLHWAQMVQVRNDFPLPSGSTLCLSCKSG